MRNLSNEIETPEKSNAKLKEITDVIAAELAKGRSEQHCCWEDTRKLVIKQFRSLIASVWILIGCVGFANGPQILHGVNVTFDTIVDTAHWFKDVGMREVSEFRQTFNL